MKKKTKNKTKQKIKQQYFNLLFMEFFFFFLENIVWENLAHTITFELQLIRTARYLERSTETPIRYRLIVL